MEQQQRRRHRRRSELALPGARLAGQRGRAEAVGATTTGRGVPDVAADADPYTGYSVRVGGANVTYGGTSAAAPLWAALLTRNAQLVNAKFGLVQSVLYNGAKSGQQAVGFRLSPRATTARTARARAGTPAPGSALPRARACSTSCTAAPSPSRPPTTPRPIRHTRSSVGEERWPIPQSGCDGPVPTDYRTRSGSAPPMAGGQMTRRTEPAADQSWTSGVSAARLRARSAPRHRPAP